VTHWMHCGRLSSSYPQITVEPDAIYIRDGAIWSSAGVTTGIDLALADFTDVFSASKDPGSQASLSYGSRRR
jgi:transcriptional regulator GlxA family with amidase domain